ncbi:MAG: hypothetical protein ACREN5_07785 [Gemmatimonadales bacterium]
MLNALIGFIQERKAERSVRALMQLMTLRARVIRNGSEGEIESRTLVRGDLVLLESGGRDRHAVSVSVLVLSDPVTIVLPRASQEHGESPRESDTLWRRMGSRSRVCWPHGASRCT